MPSVTGNLLNWAGSPRANLFPRLVLSPREPVVRAPNVFFTEKIYIYPDANGDFEFEVVDFLSTFPHALLDVSIEWLDTAGNFISVDRFPDPFIMRIEGGLFTDMLLTRPTDMEVHVGEVDDPDYGFWYQPSTALLRS